MTLPPHFAFKTIVENRFKIKQFSETDSIRKKNVRVTGIPEEVRETIFREITAEKFSHRDNVQNR